MTDLRLTFSLAIVSMLGTACFNPSDSADSGGTGTDETSMSGSGGSTSTTTTPTTGSTASASGTTSTSSTSGDTGTSTTPTSTSTDSSGGSSSTGPATNEPPEVMITVPAMDLTMGDALFYDGHDEALNLWYTDVNLQGVATDLEDGDISDLIEWTTDQAGIQDANIGMGASVDVRLYSDDCFGTLHVIHANVSDSDGNDVTSEPREIFIYTIC